jgi:predicted ATP-dependent protease
VFKFLKSAPKPTTPDLSGPGLIGESSAANDPGLAQHRQEAIASGSSGGLDAKTSADFTPASGVMGMEMARAALEAVGTAPPCTVFFIATPRSAGHRQAIAALLDDPAHRLSAADAVVAVQDFETGGLTVLRLPVSQAKSLTRQVADAIEMLSVTIPAALASDSTRVARMALDEELRSGHDNAIDALKRKALAQNIGLLRTPQGYTVAPMHEGRVVQPDVLNALPTGLKADVETKLATFQGELAGVLKDRAGLQQTFWMRLRELERETASLAVGAALGDIIKTFRVHPEIATYLDQLRDDLTRNSALFATAAREAQGQARAPIEIATDIRFARYRVNVVSPQGLNPPGVETLETLDRADLAGEAIGNASPAVLTAGALTRAGNGIVVIDARDLLAQYNVWPLIKHAVRARCVTPADASGRPLRGLGLSLPVACRIAITGEMADYLALCRLDSDVSRLVRLVTAFEPHVALTPDTQHRFAQQIAAILTEDRLQPLDGPAIAALMHDRTDTSTGVARLSTDLDAVRDIVVSATTVAKAQGRKVTLAEDVIAALKVRGDSLSHPSEAAL